MAHLVHCHKCGNTHLSRGACVPPTPMAVRRKQTEDFLRKLDEAEKATKNSKVKAQYGKVSTEVSK
jgi:hypothetical protein